MIELANMAATGDLGQTDGRMKMATESLRINSILNAATCSLQRIEAGTQIGSPADEASRTLELIGRINAADDDAEINQLVA